MLRDCPGLAARSRVAVMTGVAEVYVAGLIFGLVVLLLSVRG